MTRGKAVELGTKKKETYSEVVAHVVGKTDHGKNIVHRTVDLKEREVWTPDLTFEQAQSSGWQDWKLHHDGRFFAKVDNFRWYITEGIHGKLKELASLGSQKSKPSSSTPKVDGGATGSNRKCSPKSGYDRTGKG